MSVVQLNEKLNAGNSDIVHRFLALQFLGRDRPELVKILLHRKDTNFVILDIIRLTALAEEIVLIIVFGILCADALQEFDHVVANPG